MPPDRQDAESYTISDDPARFDLAKAHRWIAEESYWGGAIPLATFERAVRHSLTFAAYAPSGEMAGMARVVTDRATFAWIADVFVDAGHRGRGVGKRLMAAVLAHPDLQGLRRTHLATRDAHSLYARFGFTPLTRVENWMEIRGAPYAG